MPPEITSVTDMLLADNIAEQGAVQDALMKRITASHNNLMSEVNSDKDFNALLAQRNASRSAATSPQVGSGSTGGASRSVSTSGGLKYKRMEGIPGGGLTTINVGGQKWTVGKNAANSFQSLISELNRMGYKTTSSGGYVDRDIRGRPGVKSEHAYGRAIDINAASNPLGSSKTDMPANIAALAAKYNIFWGGNFSGRKDPMHFEYLGN